MKRRLLFAMLCIVSALGMRAQTWTASEVGAGNFYLYNIGKGQFLTRGNGWGTQASTGFNALTLTVEKYDDAYKLRTNVNGDGKGLERLGDPVIYTDQSAGKNSTWTFTKVADASNGPVYTIVSKDNHGGGAGSYMTASADNTIVGPADAVTDDYGKWQLFQSLITNNMPVANADGWTVSETPTFDNGNICAEFWNKSGASIKQTVTNLLAGSYELIAVALTRDGMTATLNAGANTMNIATIASGTVNNRTQANTWFNEGNGVNKLEFTHGGGDLEIGLTADKTTGDHWLVWRSFVLLYKGLDLSEFAATLAAAVAAAEAVEGTVPTAAYNALASVVSEQNKTYTTAADYTAATEAIVNATNDAKALQSQYSRYQTIKTAALAVASETDTSEADEAVEAATTTAAIDAAIATLRAAFLGELYNVEVPTTPGWIDVTNVMIDNPTVSVNTEYWNADNVVRAVSWGTGPTTNFGETEFYQSTFDFNQTIALNRGTWEFGVTGFHRAGNHSTYFYAGEDKILVPGVGSDVVNTMEQAKNYFDQGNGKVALKFIIESDQNVKIGILNQDTETDRWTIFRNFTLKYYGEPDYSVYEDQWAALVAEANAAKANAANTNVTGNELTALNNAIADEPDGSSKANYIEKIDALQAALQAFNAAAPSYDKYVAYKSETVTLFGSDLDVAVPTTAAEAITAVQNLNIAQYNKVATDYPFSLTSKIGDFSTWTGTAEVGTPRVAGTPNSLNWEHWSGTTHPYYEQDNSGYSNEGGWTIQYTKTTTLPAGSYVVKVAARSSAGVTSKVTCSALADVEISLPCAGNNTRGINTRGEASWSNEDTFIKTGGLNNDPVSDVGYSGAGWQWRFLPFTLETETEVTMTFYAEASTKNQWMSIADGELLSAENVATSVEYNDEETSDIEDVDVANVTITRKVKEGLNTVVLPFDLTLGQMEAAFGTGAEVYAYTETGDNPKDVTINFNKVAAGTISANVPVLVKATKASTEQVFEGVQVVAPTADVKVAGTNFDYVGVYAPMTVATGDYFVSDGKLFKSVGSTNLKGFRAYLKDKNPDTTGEVKLYIDGVATAISEINADVQKSGVIYNLAGQRVSKTTRGIYVKNGRKVVVK